MLLRSRGAACPTGFAPGLAEVYGGSAEGPRTRSCRAGSRRRTCDAAARRATRYGQPSGDCLPNVRIRRRTGRLPADPTRRDRPGRHRAARPHSVNLVMTLITPATRRRAGHLSWALGDLLRNPGELAKVLAQPEELVDPRPAAQAEPDATSSTRSSGRFAKRNGCHPITTGIVRRATAPIDYAGYRIRRVLSCSRTPGCHTRQPGACSATPTSYRPDRFADNPAARKRR